MYETICDEGITDKLICLALYCAPRDLKRKTDEGANTKFGEKIKEGRVWSEGDTEDSKTRYKSAHAFYWIPYIHFGV